MRKEKWEKRLWKANKPGTINYVKKIQEYQKQIDISFIKVLAHSGDTYNEIADSLAKKAVGIKWKFPNQKLKNYQKLF